MYRLTWSVCLTFTAKLGIVNSQFYRFLRLCSSSAVFSDNWSYCALKNKSYPLNNLLKEDQRFTRCISFLNFSSDFSDWFCIESFTWRAVSSPLGFVHLLPFCVLYSVPSSLCASSFLFCSSLLEWRVLASPGWVFLLLWDLQQKLSTQAAGYMAYTHCQELMKWVGCDRKVAILHVTVIAHWTCETVTAVHAASFIVQFKLVLSFGVSLLLSSLVL
jgi:hypothetical protein